MARSKKKHSVALWVRYRDGGFSTTSQVEARRHIRDKQVFSWRQLDLFKKTTNQLMETKA